METQGFLTAETATVETATAETITADTITGETATADTATADTLTVVIIHRGYSVLKTPKLKYLTQKLI